jgi:hypothetical protein
MSLVYLLQVCRVDFTGENLIEFTDALFDGCSSSANGGAVYVDNQDAIASLLQCSFIRCQTLKNGAAVSFHGSVFNGGRLACVSGTAAASASACFVQTNDAVLPLSLNHSLAIRGNSAMKAFEFLSNGGSRAAQHLANLNISFNNAELEDVALSIQSSQSSLFIAHLILSQNQGDNLMDFAAIRLPDIRCLACVRNVGTSNGVGIPHALISTAANIKFADCVFIANRFDTFIMSWSDELIATFVRCVLPRGPLAVSPESLQIVTANCTFQEVGDVLIDSGFCPTMLPQTPTATAFFTRSLLPPIRYWVIRVSMFMTAAMTSVG